MMRFFGSNASLLFWILSAVLGAVRINRTSAVTPVHGKGYSGCAKRAIRNPPFILRTSQKIPPLRWYYGLDNLLSVFN